MQRTPDDMTISCNSYRFEWVEAWARVPETESVRQNGRTHGVAAARDGSIIVFLQGQPAVVRYAADGRVVAAWGDRFAGAHGLTLVEEEGEERLWLTDEMSGEVVKTDLDGRTLARIERPDHAAYAEQRYAPTWVAVSEPRRGGNGDVWVADGYGAGLVHRYDFRGRYLTTLTGDEGAGRFDCPHGLYVRAGKYGPELVVADRGNRRLQVYTAQGRFVGAMGTEALHLPCSCIELDEHLIVPELNARLTVLDEDGSLVGYLGRNESVCERADWPNVPPEEIREGAFNSPHSVAADREGNLYVVEWIIGGRITKLARV